MSVQIRLKSEELRVGNLIWNTYHRRFERLSPAGYDNVMRGAPNASHVKGVMLTPGWCEQLGGEYITGTNITSYRFHGKFMDLIVYFDGSVGYIRFDTIKVPLETIHYFQNLFFFLCGSELTINKTAYSVSDQ